MEQFNHVNTLLLCIGDMRTNTPKGRICRTQRCTLIFQRSSFHVDLGWTRKHCGYTVEQEEFEKLDDDIKWKFVVNKMKTDMVRNRRIQEFYESFVKAQSNRRMRGRKRRKKKADFSILPHICRKWSIWPQRRWPVTDGKSLLHCWTSMKRNGFRYDGPPVWRFKAELILWCRKCLQRNSRMTAGFHVSFGKMRRREVEKLCWVISDLTGTEEEQPGNLHPFTLIFRQRMCVWPIIFMNMITQCDVFSNPWEIGHTILKQNVNPGLWRNGGKEAAVIWRIHESQSVFMRTFLEEIKNFWIRFMQSAGKIPHSFRTFRWMNFYKVNHV